MITIELVIKSNLTAINYTKKSNKNNQYIVIHWVGAASSAYNNTVYFKTINRNASAHYFVDEKEIWQCVKDHDMAWHCGTNGKYVHPQCRNNNSIGVEMCCKFWANNIYIDDITIAKTIILTKWLMQRYNIPIDNVIRHYDVTGKNCPAPFVSDKGLWDWFKDQLVKENKKMEKWQENMGLEALNKLSIDKLVEIDSWKNSLGDNTPQWLFWVMMERLYKVCKTG